MDLFTSTISSNINYLDGFDARCSIVRISMCYWYENTACGSWDRFMPPAILEQAFYRTLVDYPNIASHIKADANGRMYLEVDKNNLNMPVYSDTCCDLHYSVICESGYDLRKLPVNLSAEYGVPAPLGLVGGEIKQAYIRIIRFKDNSGVLVFASIGHCLIDGYGFTHFMNRWAEISRWLQKPQDSSQIPLPSYKYSHDRSIHANYQLDQTTALDTFTLDTVSSSSYVTSLFSWVSPETRGRLFKAISQVLGHGCCYFHISAQAMEALRNRVQAHAPKDTKLSINDVIIAYITVVVALAKERASADWWSRPVPSAIRKVLGKSGESKFPGFLTCVAINMRTRINQPDIERYMGSMVFGRSIVFPHNLINKESTDDKALCGLALKIHEEVNATDEQYIGQLGYLMNRNPDNYLRQTFCYAKIRNKLITSNQVKFAHYDVDFGAGIPTLVRHAPHAFADIAYVMPPNPKTGGYEVEFNVVSDVARYIAGNSDWMKLVDRYDLHL
ncbi:hypothetical protein IWW48_001986 [Coemansia sp. RSA 1200]|nr:hypothetical protein IWW48_001986 [Coemansia sp. RSA 1200]